MQKRKKKKKGQWTCRLSNNCENIVRICLVGVTVYANINNKNLKERQISTNKTGEEKKKKARWTMQVEQTKCTLQNYCNALFIYRHNYTCSVGSKRPCFMLLLIFFL